MATAVQAEAVQACTACSHLHSPARPICEIMYLQDTDAAVGAIFGPVLNAVPAAFYFFSLCLLQRSPSLGARMREKAGQRIAAKLGEAMPAWVMTDILALHLYACRLGGVAVHKMVKSVRAIGDDAFYEEVAEAVGALLQGEMLVFAQYGSAARALAGWCVGGMRTAAAGKARGVALGRLLPDGTGVDMNALERGEAEGAAPPRVLDLYYTPSGVGYCRDCACSTTHDYIYLQASQQILLSERSSSSTGFRISSSRGLA